MHLDSEFIRLPLRFDAARLAAEVNAIPESEWRKHPQGHVGNTALPLVAAGGNPDNDDVRGPMRPTPYLHQCPYLQQVLAALQTVIGRTRLMRIEGNGEATLHVDTNYYWMNRVRVHIPILTFPEVEFLCGDATVYMPPGECWIFDTWRMHNVLNHRPQPRIHLVCDTVGTVEFWDRVAQGDRPGDESFDQPSAAPMLDFRPQFTPALMFESCNFPIVMSPGEQEVLADWVWGQIAGQDADDAVELAASVDRFLRRWRGLWAQYGTSPTGFDAYQSALRDFDQRLEPWNGRLQLANTSDAVHILRQALVRPALNPDLVDANAATLSAIAPHAPAVPATPPRVLAAAPESLTSRGRNPEPVTRFDRPVFIVSAPRSGSTLLFETLSRSPSVRTIGQESHAVIEGIVELGPSRHGWMSNRLTEADATPDVARALQDRFWEAVAEHHGRDGLTPPVRLLEKTPKNALRVPFLNAVFPEARFIYLVRDPHESISSILEAWRSRKFVTYPEVPGWNGPWSLLLFPGWQELVGRPLNEVAAAQWNTTNQILLEDLHRIPRSRWCLTTYADLLRDPQGTMEMLCRFADLEWTDDLREQTLPPSRHTLTAPAAGKWRRNAAEIEPVLPALQETVAWLRRIANPEEDSIQPSPVAEVPVPSASPAPSSPANPPALDTGAARPAEARQSPLRSQATSTFASLLSQLNASLLVTTYQAGQLVIARVDDGRLNTHFRSFPAPMGLAASDGRLAIGTKQHVWTFRNVPALGKSLDTRVDACYAPRTMHVTGDIRIHEIGWVDDELWIVNTRFSCLCTLDPRYSFVPRWKPPFITAYTPDDRCHLNGLAIVNGRPRYCTALGATDAAGAWRENKPSGGILLDVESGEIVLRGLSMPHSPRVYRDRLWILNSGHGTLETVDLQKGTTDVVAKLPGFTRGLDFLGDFAFIGLSQVRETAVFSGVPITQESLERQSGVWVVDLRSGRIVGFLKFLDQVQEIFAVQLLTETRFPDVLEDDERLTGAFSLPDDALRLVPDALRAAPP